MGIALLDVCRSDGKTHYLILLPHHVQTLQDYWLWMDRLIGESGGYLEHLKDLKIEPFEDHMGDFIRIHVPTQRLHFYDGSVLQFHLNVLRADLECVRYRFRFSDMDQEYWRLHKHPGHEKEDGGVMTHIHRGDLRERHEEVDFGDVLDRIRAERSP